MNKIFTSLSLAAMLASASAYAAIPVVETTPAGVAGENTPLKHKPFKLAGSTTFSEGFEDHPGGFGNAADEWLPTGWSDVSKVGNTVPESGDYRHNLTWRVLTNDNKGTNGPVVQCSAHSGDAFAYIMADVAYPDHYELDEQDEWLIMPEVTPVGEDWLYFKLYYYPSWVVYNRETKGFDGRNNQLEVYASEDGGKTWKCIWNVVDDEITGKFTDDELRADLIDIYKTEYSPMYVSVKDYIGKPTKFAFRYFGSAGQPMAIDDVMVGVPVPEAAYEMPNFILRQGLSPKVDYPKNPRLLMPPATSVTWTNRSVDAMNYEWTYTDASGATATSTRKNLVTPEYEAGTYAVTPTLKASFESTVSEPFQLGHTEMQIGGCLDGSDTEGGYTGEFGVGFYDCTEPGHSVKVSSEYISLNPQIDLAWEKILGMVDGSLDLLGICSYFPKSPVPYGFDYVDIVALVNEDVAEDDGLVLNVFELDQEGYLSSIKGQTVLRGNEIPKAKREYVNLRFKFPVPVYADSDILVVVSGLRKKGNVAFPCLVATGTNYGNNLVLFNAYDANIGEYEMFKNLNQLKFSGGHFAGLLVNLGAQYSWMERCDSEEIELPYTGGEKQITLKSYHSPDRWSLTFDGYTPLNATHTATYDNATGIYTVNITVGENPYGYARDGVLSVVSPGSKIDIPFWQDLNPTVVSLPGVEADASVKATFEGDMLRVEGDAVAARVYDTAGALVAVIPMAGGKGAVNASHLAKGVYIVKIGKDSSVKVVK